MIRVLSRNRMTISALLAAPFFLVGCSGEESSKDGTTSRDGSEEVTEISEHEHTNRLIGESSPYLQQHAHNPVDWYPWGDEMFTRAREENKPILLSIGYSACHWCHVMESESFENEEIAAIMNEHFVCVKVDREERPDLDNIYMTAVQLMTQQGGWPLTVFLTPDGKPFFGGTYFPPVDAGGRPGFPSVLMQISRFYSENSESAETIGKIDELVAQIQRVSAGPGGTGEPVGQIDLSQAVDRLRRSFDETWGGFGGAPKFPSSSNLDLLLRYHFRTGDKSALSMVTHTLDKMMQGGMYDQLGGGFHRYSVDERWLIPHFEKMLYDNGLLVPVYLDAWVVTGNDAYRAVVEEILGYIEREMTASGGSFFSSEDADSEGDEGKFYVWTRSELIELLGERDGGFVADYFGVTDTGNFEHGRSALHQPAVLEAVVERHSITVDEGRKILAQAKSRMLDVRSTRVRPARDDKTLTEWNGMAITAFARAGRVLREERYIRAAEKAALFILDEMTDGDILLHTWKDGVAKQSGFLPDYAYLTQALIDLYEATWNIRYLKEAIFWNGRMVDLFSDEENGGFYFTGDANEELLARTKDIFDGSVPSGNSVAAWNLARLARLTGDAKLKAKAEAVFSCFSQAMANQPVAATTLLAALDFHYGVAREIVVVGEKNDPVTSRFLEKIASHYAPDAVVAFLDPTADSGEAASLIPLLKGKESVGEPTVFVCRNYVCDAPAKDEAALERALTASPVNF